MDNLPITLVQTDIAWEDKQANFSTLERKILSIAEKTTIVILPEMFSTGFSMRPEALAETMDGETVRWMKRIAAEKKIILTGSIIVEDHESEKEKGDGDGSGKPGYFNRLIWMLPNGNYGYYDKRHRFAYAGEDEHYSAGDKRLVASVSGWKFNLLICYDLRFPVWARQSQPSEYDVLVYVANWPEKRIQAWKTLLQARAIENQCYVIGVNRVGNDGNDIHYSGDSMVVDPLGEVLYTRNEMEDIATVTLSRSHLQNVRERFPFWKDADGFRIVDR
jgi:omega-amidase